MNDRLQEMRRTYAQAGLDVDDVASDPIDQFQRWFGEAQHPCLPDWLEVNAMTLSTATKAGQVTSRVVLLKGVSPDGFVFYTNYQSVKGQQLAENPSASLCFYWPHLERQVRIDGVVGKVTKELSDAYFRSRPRESQLGGLLSDQSKPVKNREVIEGLFNDLEKRYAGTDIPRPEHWGGYQLVPHQIEFWQGRPSRLHDRICYMLQNDRWNISRLCP